MTANIVSWCIYGVEQLSIIYNINVRTRTSTVVVYGTKGMRRFANINNDPSMNNAYEY